MFSSNLQTSCFGSNVEAVGKCSRRNTKKFLSLSSASQDHLHPHHPHPHQSFLTCSTFMAWCKCTPWCPHLFSRSTRLPGYLGLCTFWVVAPLLWVFLISVVLMTWQRSFHVFSTASSSNISCFLQFVLSRVSEWEQWRADVSRSLKGMNSRVSKRKP